MAYYGWSNTVMNRAPLYTGNYYLVANRYPLNPSMEEELNRLLGWGSVYRPSEHPLVEGVSVGGLGHEENLSTYTTISNEFTQNGRDTEYTDDVRTGPNSAPGSRTTSTSESNSLYSPNTSFSSSSREVSFSDSSRQALVKLEPKQETTGQELAPFRGVRSSVFPSAHRLRYLRKKLHCSFCKNNGERELVFASHNLKTDDGLITCPVLRNYTCPICMANGDRAHTLKYCPMRAR